jgi:hypothetical protein
MFIFPYNLNSGFLLEHFETLELIKNISYTDNFFKIKLHDQFLNNQDGFIYIIAQSSNEYDFCLPFSLCNHLWSFDLNSGFFLNNFSGEHISGRQDFPELFESDSSILISQDIDAVFNESYKDFDSYLAETEG